MSVPFLDLAAQSREIADEVLPTWRDQLLNAAFIGGEEVAAFESEAADFFGVSQCVGVGNGTDALELSLRAVGVTPRSEVILPVNTFIATAEAVCRIGARPVFVDVDPSYLLIDPAAVAAAITDHTRAIVPVHLYGQTAPMARLRAITHDADIPLVEDAAQAQGARSALGRAGSLGEIAATSFYPGKNLGAAGDAGAVLTSNPDLADQVRALGNHGSLTKYRHDVVGCNSRLDAVQAAVLRAKLRRLVAWNRARDQVADRYRSLLSEVPEVVCPSTRPGNRDVWHLYVVQIPHRDRVLRSLAAAGIGAGLHYPVPLHLTNAFRHLGYHAGAFPVAEAAAERILSLPMYPHLLAADQERVVDALRVALEEG